MVKHRLKLPLQIRSILDAFRRFPDTPHEGFIAKLLNQMIALVFAFACPFHDVRANLSD
jgi:hypothetical protein